MATKKNDIALSFDKAEYYTLQEASEYLNRKHEIDNITPKKLLKQIVSRDTNAYIHFRMDNLENHDKLTLHADSYGSNVFNFDDKENIAIYNSKPKEERLKYIVEQYEQLQDKVFSYIIDDVYMGNILFKLDYHTLSNMSLSTATNNQTDLILFDGFIHKEHLDDNPFSPVQLRQWTTEVNNKEYYMEDITNIYFVIQNANDDDLKDFESKVPFPCQFEKRPEKVFVSFKLTINDVIILHKDMELLEAKIVENAPIPEKEVSKISDISYLVGRKGVSPKKLQAKIIANAHAQHLWANYYDKKIRIGEMCEILKAYLAVTEYRDQLPEKAENLKNWLNDIPPHAKEAGRPSEQ